MHNKTFQTYKRLLSYLKKKWGIFVIGIISMAVIAATEVGLPAILQPILDGTFVNKDPFFLKWAPIGLVVLFAIRGIATLISNAAFASISTYLMHTLRLEMFTKLIRLPASYFETKLTGDLVSKFTYDVSQISQAGVDVLNTLVKDSLTVVALSVYIIWLDWKLSLFMLVMLPTTGLIAKYIGRRQKILSEELQKSFGGMTHSVDESIRGQSVIKIYNGFNKELDRFEISAKQVRQKQFKLTLSSKVGVPIVEFIGALVMAAVLYMGTQRTAIDQLTVGEFVAFFTALGLLFSPIKRLTRLTHPINMGLAAANSVFDVIDSLAENDLGNVSIEKKLHQISFINASFKYPGSSKNALHNISLEINPGETLALVGSSGSGKSTLASLIPRFREVCEGDLLISQLPIKDISLKSLRENIAFVTQEVTLFNGTVAENIAYSSNATLDEIRVAARKAHAEEFIAQLPNNFDAQLGENGAKLSGGQRQRISLARAILKNSPVLILDEATSALDNISELEIQKALEEIKGKATVIIIAHRMSTIRHADQIALLDNGQIIEYGNPTQLDQPGTKFFQFKQAHKISEPN